MSELLFFFYILYRNKIHLNKLIIIIIFYKIYIWRCSLPPCKPPSAPMGLSLWAHLAKLDSVYRVHRHDWDPVYRVHDPGVYQVVTLGRTLWGQGLARCGSFLPTPRPSLHCIPDGTCSIALLGKGLFYLREPTPDCLPTLEPGPPSFGNLGVGGGNMRIRGDMCISLCVPVQMGLQDGKELPEWHLSWDSPGPVPWQNISIFWLFL